MSTTQVNTYDPIAGTHVRDACAYLAKHAPCEATFNGVTLRSAPGDSAGDLYARFDRESAKNAAAWAASPAGKRAEVERLERVDDDQLKIDICLAMLPTLDFDDVAAVVAWTGDIAGPADHVGTKLDKGAVVELFESRGWLSGANCGAAFNGEDARNFAGWVVGQWLACGHPMMEKFAGDWRAKFVAKKPA